MKRSENGTALIDALMAVVILAITAALLSALLPTSHATIRSAEELGNAAYVAQKVADDLRSRGGQALVEGAEEIEGTERLGTTMYDWKAKQRAMEAGVAQVRITVGWEDAHKNFHTQKFLSSARGR